MVETIRKLLISSVVAATLGVVVIAGWSYQLVHRPLLVPANDTHLVTIARGASAGAIINQLAAEGRLRHAPKLYYWSSRIWDRPVALQAGVYQLHSGQTLAQFWQQLRQGEQYQFAITLVEGQTWSQWASLLHQHDYLDSRDVEDDVTLVRRVTGSEEYTSFEGLLAPDTYKFYAGTSVLTLLEQAFALQQQRLQQAWEQRLPGLPYETPYQLLIMASIIEKETGGNSERGLVSSVFVNRLQIGMRLQSDPTTIYGVENFDGNLTRQHLREKTAYNTYRIDGLPPTPIAMPSYASLLAAAQPEVSGYYYFVADGSGGHVFSETLAEHNRAVDRYQRGNH